jgi:isoquinoline 1-oxidoreductase beta subunit
VKVADGKIRVEKVWCAADVGFAINPLGVREQMESGIVYGLSAALHGAITLEGGRTVQGNFNNYPVVRIDEAPEIEVEIVQSGEAIGGAGEPGTPPIFPAVGNAIFAATGQRLRSLPFRLG